MTGVKAKSLQSFEIHPDGKQIALNSHADGKTDIWALENFLPPLDEPKPAAANASAPQSAIASSALPSRAAPPDSPVLRELRLPESIWRIIGTLGDLSADGTKIAFSVPTGDKQIITVRDVASGKDERFKSAEGVRPVFSPDAKQIAFQRSVFDPQSGWKVGVSILNLESGQITHTGIAGRPWDWSSDGKSILITDGPIKLLNVADYQTRTVPGASRVYFTRGRSLRLSPDGKYVLLGKQGDNVDVYMVPIDGGEPLRLTDDPAIDCDPLLSTDGQTLLFKSNRQLGRWDLWAQRLENNKPAGKPVLIKPDIGEHGNHYAWSKTGQVLFSTYEALQQNFVTKVNPSTGKLEGTPTKFIAEESLIMPRWSPDNSRIAYFTRSEHDLNVVGADGTGKRRLTQLGAWTGGPCAWLPDNDHIIYVDKKPDPSNPQAFVHGIYSASATTGEIQPIYTSTQKLAHLDCSPDGMLVTFCNEYIEKSGSTEFLTGAIHTINIDGTNVRQINSVTPKIYVYYPRFSPDGREIFFTQHDETGPWHGSIMAIPVAGGAPREVYGTNDIADRSFSWTFPSTPWLPNGRLVFEDAKHQLWAINADGSKSPERFGDTSTSEQRHIGSLYISSTCDAALFRQFADYGQVWLMENFLPPLKGE